MTFRRVRVTTVAVDKQKVLHILSVCVCNLSYPVVKRMRHIVICGLPVDAMFFRIISLKSLEKKSY